MIVGMTARPHHAVAALFALLALAPSASAQVIEGTIFGGVAFPFYDERLTIGNPTFPGVEVTVPGSPSIRADGGAVFGGVIAASWGHLGIEGRVDGPQLSLDFSGARYDLLGTGFPFQGLTASIRLSEGRFDVNRIPLLSINGRFSTPGRIAFVASGGFSYLPDITVTGSIPLAVDAPALPGLPAFDAGLALRASPGQSGHRLGVNGGAGIRVGGRVALTAELRGFYFGEYDLRFSSEAGDELIDELLAEAAPVSFRPVFVNALIGVSFRF